MFYVKNVPNWERMLRVVLGLVAFGFSYQSWGVTGLGVGLGIMGAMLAFTGLFGFCPLCAMVGRKLDKAK